ncbi:MAG: hypothetical protein ACRYF4_07600 [Janthinobacterium lividum]
MRKLNLHVGESMKDVLAKNQRANFNPDVMFDNVPIVWPENDLIPHVFDMAYDGPDGTVRFPHARLVYATQYAGIVTDILVGVSEKKETLSAFVSEAQEVAA